MNIEFENVEELYLRVLPALRSKVKELKRDNKLYIKERDIFEYLSNNVWNKSNNLYLDKIVDDIICLNNDDIDNYVQNKIIKEKLKNYVEKDEDKWN